MDMNEPKKMQLDRRALEGSIVFPIEYMVWAFEEQYARIMWSGGAVGQEHEEYFLTKSVSNIEQTIRTVCAKAVDENLVPEKNIESYLQSFTPDWKAVRAIANGRYSVGEVTACSLLVSTREKLMHIGDRVFGSFREKLRDVVVLYHSDPDERGSPAIKDFEHTFAVLGHLYDQRNAAVHRYGDTQANAQYQFDEYFYAARDTMNACHWLLTDYLLKCRVSETGYQDIDKIEVKSLETELRERWIAIGDAYGKTSDESTILCESIKETLTTRAQSYVASNGKLVKEAEVERQYTLLLMRFLSLRDVSCWKAFSSKP